jgi:hypothetical protein
MSHFFTITPWTFCEAYRHGFPEYMSSVSALFLMGGGLLGTFYHNLQNRHEISGLIYVCLFLNGVSSFLYHSMGSYGMGRLDVLTILVGASLITSKSFDIFIHPFFRQKIVVDQEKTREDLSSAVSRLDSQPQCSSTFYVLSNIFKILSVGSFMTIFVLDASIHPDVLFLSKEDPTMNTFYLIACLLMLHFFMLYSSFVTLKIDEMDVNGEEKRMIRFMTMGTFVSMLIGGIIWLVQEKLLCKLNPWVASRIPFHGLWHILSMHSIIVIVQVIVFYDFCHEGVQPTIQMAFVANGKEPRFFSAIPVWLKIFLKWTILPLCFVMSQPKEDVETNQPK